MHYHCLKCSQSVKRSQVEKIPNQKRGTEHRKHKKCGGTAIIVGIQNKEWTDGEKQMPLKEFLEIN